MSEVTSKARKQRSIGWWIFRVMAGYELAILCLLLLSLLLVCQWLLIATTALVQVVV